jgi:predicted AlkP superfamily phosphohydrolase/phosphomutase
MAKRRVAVIGLDAADFEFMDPWRKAGDLPVLDGLLKAGASGPLRSTIPPVSSPAWATFMTGLNPGAHGLYDFVMEDPATCRPVLARHDLIRGTRIWEAVGAAGLRTTVVNLPITWPTRPFPGSMVTGMLTPEGVDSFTHPPELAKEIRSKFPGYRCDIDVALKADPAALVGHLGEVARMNAGVMGMLLDREDWDLFVGIFTTTDRAKHLFWPKLQTVVREHYRLVDRLVGEILARLGPEDLVLLMSDHGFHSVGVKFYTNRWLEKRGWLVTKPRAVGGAAPAPGEDDLKRGEAFFRNATRKTGFLGRVLGWSGTEEDVEIDLSRTRAYLSSAWTGGVKVNLKGRSVHGIVEPGAEYERLRDEIIAGLKELKYPGEDGPLFGFVGRAEEVYRGTMMAWGPDVVVRSIDYRVTPGKNLSKGRLLRVSKHEQGTHSDTGILGIRGPGVKGGTVLKGAGIEDVMPTVLWALGLEVPAGLDGKVLVDAFTDETMKKSPVRIAAAAAAADSSSAGSGRAMTDAEEEELKKTLEGLGYI